MPTQEELLQAIEKSRMVKKELAQLLVERRKNNAMLREQLIQLQGPSSWKFFYNEIPK